ncbi:MAG TPA: hypothetical protein VHW74_02345 [Mycobacteriales bacterium]|jgi:hypothetical protein|nr:hypothetical protein [Mycobacteriales bacterium]
MSAIDSQTKAFEVRGVRNGSVVTIRWDDGALSGDPPTLDLIQVMSEIVEIGATDPIRLRSGTVPDDGFVRPSSWHPLDQAVSALDLIRLVVDRLTRITTLPGPAGAQGQ